MAGFRFGGGDARTTIIGATGSGKSTCGVWMLAHQRFDRRPWIAFDFKREELFDHAGFPPIVPIDLGDPLPKKPGLYLVSPLAGRDDEDVEEYLWSIWHRGNIGVYVDEAYLMPDRNAFKAIYQQGRSLRIPVIACTQRPVDVPRVLFSEAGFFAVYQLVDRRDYSVVAGFVPHAEDAADLPPYHWLWYDRQRRTRLHMAPVPNDAGRLLASRLPEPKPSSWHPFGFVSKPSSSRLKA